MKILKFALGEFGVNSYIVKGEKESFIVDPGELNKEFLSAIPKNIKYIINTHAHFDHIEGNLKLKELTNAKILIHAFDKEMLTNPSLNLSIFVGKEIISPKPDIIIEKEEDYITIDDKKWKILNTPGHTEGMIILVNEEEKIIFSGDLIFEDSYGRTDLPTGDGKKMKNSLNQISKFSGEYLIYPGHGEQFFLKDFKNWINYFLKEI